MVSPQDRWTRCLNNSDSPISRRRVALTPCLDSAFVPCTCSSWSTRHTEHGCESSALCFWMWVCFCVCRPSHLARLHLRCPEHVLVISVIHFFKIFILKSVSGSQKRWPVIWFGCTNTLFLPCSLASWWNTRKLPCWKAFGFIYTLDGRAEERDEAVVRGSERHTMS